MLGSRAIGSQLQTACSSGEHASASCLSARQLAAVVSKHLLMTVYYWMMMELRNGGQRDPVKTRPPPTCSCLNHVTTADAGPIMNWQVPAFLQTNANSFTSCRYCKLVTINKV